MSVMRFSYEYIEAEFNYERGYKKYAHKTGATQHKVGLLK